jgi:hypothetical protein
VTPAGLSQLLLLYTWFALAAVLGFLLLIARFYERFSGERMRYRWFVLPIIGYGLASVRYASIDRLGGDALGDALAALAGVALMVLCAHMLQRMVGGRKAL